VQLGPRETAPRLLLGKLLMRRGDLAGAAREFESALQLDPANVTAMYQLATVYRKTGKTQRADELFDKVSQARSAPTTDSPSLTLEHLLRR
jgi:Tfp pilus assembly protein PilF